MNTSFPKATHDLLERIIGSLERIEARVISDSFFTHALMAESPDLSAILDRVETDLASPPAREGADHPTAQLAIQRTKQLVDAYRRGLEQG